ncbi:MAG: MFS transporter [Alcaligenes faecalis]|jgi:predicted MFS family arabinose efflux permease|uniref:MFS transporter n=1 Tax=Alcaligenes aquatilis TaxID=323284 RepID=UPI003873437C|nr:MFS transporter [Alcaligenes faecalis]
MNTSSLSMAGQPGKRQSWLAVGAVGLATFSVVTTEMLPVGLLTSIAGSLQTSTGKAGLLISLPALLAALFAPLVVLVSGGVDRRRILCGLLALLVVANIASALAPSIVWMLAARVLVGFCMGGIWAIAGGLASRLVPAQSVGLATSIIFGGVAAASVLGVPLGALMGDLLGWRWAFGGMALLSASVLIFHLAVIPPLSVSCSTTWRQFVEQFGNRRLWFGLLLTLMLVAGHFSAFTFVRPLLLSVSGIGSEWIGGLLFAYGVAGIVGNFLIGISAAQRTEASLMAIALGISITALLFLTVGGSPLGGGVILLLWGLAYGGVSVGLMSWMMKAAANAVEVATALYVAVFNIGIALGSWLGGQFVDAYGLSANLGLAGLASFVVFLLLFGIILRHKSCAKKQGPD